MVSTPIGWLNNIFLIPFFTGCPPCSTLFRLCLKEYQSSMPSLPGVLSGCSFGNASTLVLGGSSFVLTEPEVGSVVLPFTFRWTVSSQATSVLYFLGGFNQPTHLVNPITWKWYKTFCGMLSRAEEEEANRIISNQLAVIKCCGGAILKWHKLKQKTVIISAQNIYLLLICSQSCVIWTCCANTAHCQGES